MINNRAMPVLLSARRVALHHPRSSPTVNDFAGALLIGRYYERFADHAVSVARRVAFIADKHALDYAPPDAD